MQETYSDFFRKVAEVENILPFQARYGSNPFSPSLLIVPTGLGKTDTVLLPWLYAHATGDASAPTRLIIVLPRQNLTRQTATNARRRVATAGVTVRVLELMGGSADNDETLRPDEPTIIVATQDLYFSRALNRGYARRAPRWPIDFALYNQDCLIVLDEIQLMDDALATSTQLAAFRDEFKTYGAAPTIWMSATINPDWLCTVDFGEFPRRIELEEEDYSHAIVKKRYRAQKSLGAAPESCREPAGCAAFVLEQHRPGTRSLVIANTVPRAREIFKAVRAGFKNTKLLHSRFRPAERQRTGESLVSTLPPEGEIVVATQVLEAGIDITSRLLVTDAAPWGSLVQRFGRVNRYGDDADAEIWWVDQPAAMNAKQKNPFVPYEAAEVERAIERVKLLRSASPVDLPKEDGPAPWQNVLRRADLLDLFDTTPDLAGNEIDVSRFIRAGEDKDAYLAWREWEGDGPPDKRAREIADEEFCPVSLGELREFRKKHPIYVWNFATERWGQPDRDELYAGMMAVTRCAEGGYTNEEGWSPESRLKVEPQASCRDEMQGDSSDSRVYQDYTQSLCAHTRRVCEETEALIDRLQLNSEHRDALRRAARKHDWGKVHDVFQTTLHAKDGSTEILAKQLRSLSGSHERRHFRHELASALAMIATGDSDLAAYLVAAHHGRVRLGIRSMPGENEAGGRKYARGISDGDVLRRCELTPGEWVEEVRLSLDVMSVGAEGGSWTERMLRLREEIGPFRLAWLEMLLRAADEKASANPNLEDAACTM